MLCCLLHAASHALISKEYILSKLLYFRYKLFQLFYLDILGPQTGHEWSPCRSQKRVQKIHAIPKTTHAIPKITHAVPKITHAIPKETKPAFPKPGTHWPQLCFSYRHLTATLPPPYRHLAPSYRHLTATLNKSFPFEPLIVPI